MSFTHLHVHSCYSVLDSNAKFVDLISRTKELGQTAIAQTDHGYIMQAPEFAKLATKNGIKYIYGCEVYECDDRFVKDNNNRYFHLILLAMNETGRVNLNKIVSLSDKEGFYYRARCDWELLERYNEGLICLSACMGSRLDKALMDYENVNRLDKARDVAKRFSNIFTGRYYIEVQSHRDKDQISVNRELVDLARELSIPIVATSDVHYVKAEDRFFHDEIFVKIGNDRDVSEYYTDCYLQSEEEVIEFLQGSLTSDEIAEAVSNTQVISDMCNVQIPFSQVVVPSPKIPEWFGGDFFEYFKYLCYKGFQEHGLDKVVNTKEYKDRLDFEINVLHELEYDKYLLYVLDKTNIIKEIGELGDARGSVAGCLAAWLIGVTRIDSVKWGCLFERFADMADIENPKEHRHVADVDLDCGSKERDAVFERMIKDDGEDRVVSIMAVQYMWAKSSIKDIGRLLGIPFEITNEITKSISSQELTDDVINNEIKEEYRERYPLLFEYAQKLAGLPRNISIHASGKITTIKEAVWYAPIRYLDGIAVTQCDMDTVDLLGMLKFDLLGLRTRNVIGEARDLAGLSKDALEPHNIDTEDRKILRLFEEGRTDGIFQFEEDFVKNVINKISITSIDDLAMVTSLCRPGAMSMISHFVARKNGKEEIEYLHPDLEPILKKSQGIVIFQESVIEIGKYAGMKYPDVLRKAVAKKKPELLQKSKPELFDGLLKKRWTLEQIEMLWKQILEFGGYAFNIGHAISYAMTSYESAWLKVYYPLQFWTAVLNSYEGKAEKVAETLASMNNEGVCVKVPDYKNIANRCFIKDKCVYLGTNVIKHLSSHVSEDISWAKGIDLTKEKFIDFLIYNEELSENKVGKTTIQILIKIGCFDCVADRAELIDIHEQFHKGKGLKYDAGHKEKTKAQRVIALGDYVKEQKVQKARVRDILDWESNALGIPSTVFDTMPADYGYIVEIEKSKYANNNGGCTTYFKIYGLRSGNVKRYQYGKGTSLEVGGIVQLLDVVHGGVNGKYKTPVIKKYKKLT